MKFKKNQIGLKIDFWFLPPSWITAPSRLYQLDKIVVLAFLDTILKSLLAQVERKMSIT